MPFQPGQSGNPAGSSPKQRRFSATLDRAIEQDESKRLRAAAEKLLDLAAAGESWAVGMLADRLDGKPKQQVVQTGIDDGPVELKATVEFVNADSNSQGT